MTPPQARLLPAPTHPSGVAHAHQPPTNFHPPILPLQSFHSGTSCLLQSLHGDGRIRSFPKKLVKRQERTLREAAPRCQRIDFALESAHLHTHESLDT